MKKSTITAIGAGLLALGGVKSCENSGNLPPEVASGIDQVEKLPEQLGKVVGSTPEAIGDVLNGTFGGFMEGLGLDGDDQNYVYKASQQEGAVAEFVPVKRKDLDRTNGQVYLQYLLGKDAAGEPSFVAVNPWVDNGEATYLKAGQTIPLYVAEIDQKIPAKVRRVEPSLYKTGVGQEVMGRITIMADFTYESGNKTREHTYQSTVDFPFLDTYGALADYPEQQRGGVTEPVAQNILFGTEETANIQINKAENWYTDDEKVRDNPQLRRQE